jgi:hypothetical protein
MDAPLRWTETVLECSPLAMGIQKPRDGTDRKAADHRAA